MYEEIKAEIERLRKANEASEEKEYAQYELDVKCGYDDALNDLLSFVESLEKEQSVDLEKEIICYKVPFSDEREYLNETTLDAIAYHFYNFGLNAKAAAPKIKGWVARDKNAACTVFFQDKMPYRRTRRPFSWACNGGCWTMRLNPYLFKEITWEDEPIEVELTISRVNK